MKLTVSEGCNIYAENCEVSGREQEWCSVRVSHPQGQVYVILTLKEMEEHAETCRLVLDKMRKAEDDKLNERIASLDRPPDPEGDFVRKELTDAFKTT